MNPQISETVLAALSELPAVRDLIAKAEADAHQAAAAARVACIDALGEAEKAELVCREAEGTQRPIMEKAFEAYVKERGKLGHLAQQTGAASAKAHALRKRLRVELGEQYVQDAETILNRTRTGLVATIENAEAIATIKPKWPQETERLQKARADAERARENAEAKLVRVDEALRAVHELRLARISPSELREQCEALLRSCDLKFDD